MRRLPTFAEAVTVWFVCVVFIIFVLVVGLSVDLIIHEL